MCRWKLTSGSPWTRTSISSSSWSSTTLRISSLIALSYSSAEILKQTRLRSIKIKRRRMQKQKGEKSAESSFSYLLALYSRRTLLNSAVWGNDPIVVVGRIGRFIFFCQASSLSWTSVARRWSKPFNAAAWESKQSHRQEQKKDLEHCQLKEAVKAKHLQSSEQPHRSLLERTFWKPELRHWQRRKPEYVSIETRSQ